MIQSVLIPLKQLPSITALEIHGQLIRFLNQLCSLTLTLIKLQREFLILAKFINGVVLHHIVHMVVYQFPWQKRYREQSMLGRI